MSEEYRVVRLDGASPEAIAELLTKASDQGFDWVDAITVSNASIAVLKRPKTHTHPTP
jgi:hypothetical protein